MADGGGERQLTYTQDNVSVRLLGPQGEDTVAGKLEITKERHGHVVTWAPYPPAAKERERYDEDATGIWEDLTADSAVSYHVGRSRNRSESSSADTVKIRKEEESGSGDSSPTPAHVVSFEVTDLASYRCRQLGDKHELTLNLNDGTRLPTFVFLERRHDHFVRALHEHVVFKRSDPDDPNSLVHVSPLQATSPATKEVTSEPANDAASQAWSHSASKVTDQPTSQAAVQASPAMATDALSSLPPPSSVFKPGTHTLRFFLPRAPNVTVVPGPAGGPAKLVPGQQAVRLLLSQPQPVAHPVQLLVQPPPVESCFPSGLVISDVRSQAPSSSGGGHSPPAFPAVRRRGPHWPTEEKMELLALLRRRRMLVNPRLADGISKKEKLDGWKEVTATLNRHHPATGGRCVAEVKKQWQNLFLKAKRERRELLSDAAKNGLESTSLQLSVLSLKVFETFGDNYGAPEDEVPEDMEASNAILGPSSCLEQEAPFLSESHHPEVILLPRSPDGAEQQVGGHFACHSSDAPSDPQMMTNGGEGSGPQTGGHGSRRRRRPSDCPTDTWGFKREKKGDDASGSDEENDGAGGSFNDDDGHGWPNAFGGGHPHPPGGLNGLSNFVGPLAKMCDVVQRAASEVLSLKRREHKMKMAALRAKVDYYELKKRKLQSVAR